MNNKWSKCSCKLLFKIDTLPRMASMQGMLVFSHQSWMYELRVWSLQEHHENIVSDGKIFAMPYILSWWQPKYIGIQQHTDQLWHKTHWDRVHLEWTENHWFCITHTTLRHIYNRKTYFLVLRTHYQICGVSSCK